MKDPVKLSSPLSPKEKPARSSSPIRDSPDLPEDIPCPFATSNVLFGFGAAWRLEDR